MGGGWEGAGATFWLCPNLLEHPNLVVIVGSERPGGTCRDSAWVVLRSLLHPPIPIFAAHLHDVLNDWGPPGELVGLLTDPLLPLRLAPAAQGGLGRKRQGPPETRGLQQRDWGHPRGVLGLCWGLSGCLPRGREGRGEQEVDTHVCDDGHPEVGHVGDDLAVLCWDLGVLDQLVQVLLSDTWKGNREMVSFGELGTRPSTASSGHPAWWRLGRQG